MALYWYFKRLRGGGRGSRRGKNEMRGGEKTYGILLAFQEVEA